MDIGYSVTHFSFSFHINKFFVKVHTRMGTQKRFLKTFRPQAKHSVQLLARGEMKSTEKFSKNKKKFGTLHEFACHPCAGAMLIFSVSFQF